MLYCNHTLTIRIIIETPLGCRNALEHYLNLIRDKVIRRSLSLKNLTIEDYINLMYQEPIRLLNRVRNTVV